MSVEEDVRLVTGSLRMLLPWQEHQEWWERFSELTAGPDGTDPLSMPYLKEKLGYVTSNWGEADGHDISERAKYVLMIFDNPALHEHLDAVQGTWSPQVPGAIGRRWAEALCAAAWRLLVHVEQDNLYGNNFTLHSPTRR